MAEKIVGLDNPELNQEANDIWDPAFEIKLKNSISSIVQSECC